MVWKVLECSSLVAEVVEVIGAAEPAGECIQVKWLPSGTRIGVVTAAADWAKATSWTGVHGRNCEAVRGRGGATQAVHLRITDKE